MVARLIREGSASRHVATLVGGAAGAQLINAASAPLLTRLFGPAEMGALGLYLGFLYVAAVLLSLRYEQAIVIPEKQEDAGRLAVMSILLVPITAGVTVGVLAFLTIGEIGGFGSLPLAGAGVAFLTLVATGVFTTFRFWLIRMHRFALISQVLVTQSIARAVVQVASGVVGLGVIGLLLGDFVGRAAGLVRVGRVASGDIRSAAAASLTSSRELAGRYRKFPMLGVPSSLINAAAFALPLSLLAVHYGIAAAGFFALIQRVLGLPLTVIGASVADVLLGRIAMHARDTPDRAMPLFRRTALWLGIMGTAIGIVVVIAAPVAFPFIFGRDWATAGSMASIMAPWYAAAFIVSPLSRVVLVYEGQGSKLIYDVLSLLVVVISISGSSAMGLDVLAAVMLLAIGQVLAYAVYFFVLVRLVRRASRRGVAVLPPETG